MTDSKDVVFAITEEIGTDITYVRQKYGEQRAAYFTGIEIGILFGGSILANFLVGMLKGATEEVTDAAGKGLGKELASRIIKQLRPLAEEAHYKETDTERLLKLADEHAKELDEIRKVLAANVEPAEMNRIVRTHITYEREEIETHLRGNGFTEEKATLHSERLVRTIQEEFLG
jgi:hypothetical protein